MAEKKKMNQPGLFRAAHEIAYGNRIIVLLGKRGGEYSWVARRFEPKPRSVIDSLGFLVIG